MALWESYDRVSHFRNQMEKIEKELGSLKQQKKDLKVRLEWVEMFEQEHKVSVWLLTLRGKIYKKETWNWK